MLQGLTGLSLRRDEAYLGKIVTLNPKQTLNLAAVALQHRHADATQMRSALGIDSLPA